MLQRILLISVLLLSATSSWAKNDDNSFCRGFIVMALAAESVDGIAKIDLWLGWDATVAKTGGDNQLNESEYQSGRDKFDSLYAAGNSAALADLRDDDCDMGRN
jgi:hypothetical protein